MNSIVYGGQSVLKRFASKIKFDFYIWSDKLKENEYYLMDFNQIKTTKIKRV